MNEFGPQGGNLGSLPSMPMHDPEWRRAELDTEVLPNGTMGLHRFGPFHDTSTVPIKNEQPWHRMAAYMLNVGRTNSEVAIAAGVQPMTVTHLRAQRWFQELCATIANNEGEEILGAIKSEVLDSINTIVRLRDDYDLPARVRLSAAITLLEHGRGKPTQVVVSEITHHNSRRSPQDEMFDIQERLAQIRKLRSNGTTGSENS